MPYGSWRQCSKCPNTTWVDVRDDATRHAEPLCSVCVGKKVRTNHTGRPASPAPHGGSGGQRDL